MKTKLSIALTLFIAFSLSATAFQAPVQSGDSIAKKIPAAALKFRTAGWVNIEQPLYYEVYQKPKRKSSRGNTANSVEEQDKKYAQLTISEMQQSDLCLGMPGSDVSFYERVDTQDGYSYKAVAKSKVNQANGKYIFLIFPKLTNGTYPVYTVPDNAQDSEPAAYQFHNLSDSTITGLLNEKKFELSKQKRVVTIDVDKHQSESYAFGLYEKTKNGRPDWLARNTFHSKPNKHLKLFIRSTTDINGRVKVQMKGLVDFFPGDQSKVITKSE